MLSPSLELQELSSARNPQKAVEWEEPVAGQFTFLPLPIEVATGYKGVGLLKKSRGEKSLKARKSTQAEQALGFLPGHDSWLSVHGV